MTILQDVAQAAMKKAIELAPEKLLPGGKPDPLVGTRSAIGQPIARVDGGLKVRGAARFAAEFPLDGMVYAALGEVRAARVELERAHRIAPADVGVRVDLAVLDLAEGRADQAWARLEGIEAAAGEGDRLRFYQGVALDQLGREDEALERLGPLAEQVYGKYAAEARQYLASRRA